MEFFIKSVDTSAGIDKLLLTGKKRMALGANLDTDVLLGRTSLDHLAASAGNGGLLVVGMNTFLHDFHLFRNTSIHSI